MFEGMKPHPFLTTGRPGAPCPKTGVEKCSSSAPCCKEPGPQEGMRSSSGPVPLVRAVFRQGRAYQRYALLFGRNEIGRSRLLTDTPWNNRNQTPLLVPRKKPHRRPAPSVIHTRPRTSGTGPRLAPRAPRDPHQAPYQRYGAPFGAPRPQRNPHRYGAPFGAPRLS